MGASSTASSSSGIAMIVGVETEDYDTLLARSNLQSLAESRKYFNFATFFKFYMAISAVSTLQQLEASITDCEALDHLISVNHFPEHRLFLSEYNCSLEFFVYCSSLL